MIIPVTTLAFAAQLTIAVADNVPRFNLEPVCRGIPSKADWRWSRTGAHTRISGTV